LTSENDVFGKDNPVGDLLAVAVGAGAAQDDPDSVHDALLAE
jgi:hypothetical protein